jgi:hypothetical protein
VRCTDQSPLGHDENIEIRIIQSPGFYRVAIRATQETLAASAMEGRS